MPELKESDSELLRQALAGEERALGSLLDRYRAWLKLLTRRRFDGHPLAEADASDVAQQATLSAVRAFPRFEGRTIEQFLAWLREIHHHTTVDFIRRSVAEKRGGGVGWESLLSEPADRQASPSQRLLQDERAGELASAIERLPEDQREAVRLRHLEGWSLADMARRMNRSEAAVAGLVKRGLSALRNVLQE